jgi:nucleoside 2-deoxyribosyltransferase
MIMAKRSMYWAGPRCFVASLRHYDSITISLLEKNYFWIVYNPMQLVADAIKKDKNAQVFGKNGIIRRTCLEYVDKSDIVVAYNGLIWDSGTAREVEHAVIQGKPILAWSDSSVIYGETFDKNEVIDGNEIEKLYVKAMPFNAMDIVFDKFLRLSSLDGGLDEATLAREIDRVAREILNSSPSLNSR